MTEYLTGEQVDARYHICRMTRFRWEKNPKMGFPRPYRFGRRKLWSRAELDAWDRAHRPVPSLPGVPSATRTMPSLPGVPSAA